MRSIDPRSLAHVGPVAPLHFPSEEPEDEHLGQTSVHADMCAALKETLMAVIGDTSTVGYDQFVYYNGADPRRCLAPDAFVKVGAPQAPVKTWKIWERGGPPDVAFEVLSQSDKTESLTLAEKVRRYHELGVSELIAFDHDAAPGTRLLAWDRIDDELVPRVIDHERTPCATLSLHVVVAGLGLPGGEITQAIRLSHDVEGSDLVLTNDEARRAAEEGKRAAEEGKRAAEEGKRAAEEGKRAAEEGKRAAEEGKRAAEARIAELEAELKKRER